MTRPAILRRLDVCEHEKCSACGGVEMPHRGEGSFRKWHYGALSPVIQTRDVECYGNDDDIACECRGCMGCGENAKRGQDYCLKCEEKANA